MQRVNYGRALLELAIVRISTLENMNQISLLAQSVAEGRAISVPATGKTKSPAETRSTPLADQRGMEAAKKNDSILEKNSSESTSEAVEDENCQNDQPQLEFSESTLTQFWEGLIEQVPERLADHLKNAVSRAISGPNVLEILFPKSYLFSKTFCERPEPQKKLAEVARKLTGSEVHCRFKN